MSVVDLTFYFNIYSLNPLLLLCACIGRRIFEDEQEGKERADYGSYLIKNVARQIEPEFGSDFSVRQLERARQFYRLYPIASTLRTQLNWSQYKMLISIEDVDKREYYELESVIGR